MCCGPTMLVNASIACGSMIGTDHRSFGKHLKMIGVIYVYIIYDNKFKSFESYYYLTAVTTVRYKLLCDFHR